MSIYKKCEIYYYNTAILRFQEMFSNVRKIVRTSYFLNSNLLHIISKKILEILFQRGEHFAGLGEGLRFNAM